MSMQRAIVVCLEVWIVRISIKVAAMRKQFSVSG